MWEFRNLTASCSHSQLLDERWSASRNHFCKFLFWDQTAHPTPQRYWCIVWVREAKKKTDGISIVLVLLQFTVENYDMMSCQLSRKKTLRFLLSIASMVGGSSNTMMNYLELTVTANYQTLFWCMSQLWPLRSYSSAPTSNETPFQRMSFLQFPYTRLKKNMTLWFHSLLLNEPCISWWIFSPPVRWGLLDFMSVSSPPSSSSSPSSPSSFSSINWDPLCSVWRAGPQWQLGSSQFSVACWTPIATGILSVQCGVLDPNRDLMSSVWRAGPQPRYCEFSVACWTPTAILRVECGVLDPNRDSASSVWRAGPQPRYCVLSVACWTPERVVKEVVARCHKINQIECQQICLQEGQKECVRENGQKYVRSVRRECLGKVVRTMFKNMSAEVGVTWSSGGHNKYDVWVATLHSCGFRVLCLCRKATCVFAAPFK